MKKFAIFCLLFLTACANAAPIQIPLPATFQTNPTPSATQVQPPSPRVTVSPAYPRLDPTQKIQRDVTYCLPEGDALKMDLYYPLKSNQPAPVAVFVHGGGWSSGDKTSGNLIPFKDLAAQGFLVAAVDYRLAPKYKFPAMIEDVKCAVRFLRANASALNIDPNKFGAWGDSAGGHLVALLGTTDADVGFDRGEYAGQSSRVQAVVDMYGPTDFQASDIAATHVQTYRVVFGALSRDDPMLKRASPVTYITQDDPPFLILHGEKDTLVPPSQSQELYDRLKAAGVPATLVMVKNAGHSFVPSGGAISPASGELIRIIQEFFIKNLK